MFGAHVVGMRETRESSESARRAPQKSTTLRCVKETDLMSKQQIQSWLEEASALGQDVMRRRLWELVGRCELAFVADGSASGGKTVHQMRVLATLQGRTLLPNCSR